MEISCYAVIIVLFSCDFAAKKPFDATKLKQIIAAVIWILCLDAISYVCAWNYAKPR